MDYGNWLTLALNTAIILFTGMLLLLAFLAFFYNIVMSVGLNGVIGIFAPTKLKTKDLMPKTK